MSQPLIMLTPKNVYRLITGNLSQVCTRALILQDRTNCTTLTKFWWNALMGIVPGDILDPYFNVDKGRLRSLSDIMNRTRTPALPHKLKEGLQAGLQPERFRSMVQWFFTMLDPAINVSKACRILNDMEDLCARQDDEFRFQLPFFMGLRSYGNSYQMKRTKGMYLVAIRLSWLSLHAIFGDDMDNSYLAALRQHPECSESSLWDAFAQSNGKIPVADEKLQPVSAEVCLSLDEQIPDFDETAVIDELNRARRAADDITAAPTLFTQYTGWYVVANWTDPCVALNETAKPTYKGATLLDQVMNGTPVYIYMASGYDGLNKSSGCWGYTYYKGQYGYVPMTYLIRLR